MASFIRYVLPGRPGGRYAMAFNEAQVEAHKKEIERLGGVITSDETLQGGEEIWKILRGNSR